MVVWLPRGAEARTSVEKELRCNEGDLDPALSLTEMEAVECSNLYLKEENANLQSFIPIQKLSPQVFTHFNFCM